jgi:6-phosphogluconolactonase
MPNDIARRDFADGEDLAPAFAEWTADKLCAAIAERGAATLIVSGGKTPARFFDALSSMPLDWTRVAVTLADERPAEAMPIRAVLRGANDRLTIFAAQRA